MSKRTMIAFLLVVLIGTAQAVMAAPEVTTFFGEVHNWEGQTVTADCDQDGNLAVAVVQHFPGSGDWYVLQIECPDPANSLVFFYADGFHVATFPYYRDAGLRVDLWLPHRTWLPLISIAPMMLPGG